MNIRKDEINKKATSILAIYNVGAAIKRTAARELNNLLGVHPATPLTVTLLLDPPPKGVDVDSFNKLRELYSSGTSLMNENIEKMLQIWDSELHHIIKTEFAPYSRYKNDLYQEGITAILSSIPKEFPEVYTYYRRQITAYMYHFLYAHELVLD